MLNNLVGDFKQLQDDQPICSNHSYEYQTFYPLCIKNLFQLLIPHQEISTKYKLNLTI